MFGPCNNVTLGQYRNNNKNEQWILLITIKYWE